MDNYGTVDNPAWISTVFCALMLTRSLLVGNPLPQIPLPQI